MDVATRQMHRRAIAVAVEAAVIAALAQHASAHRADSLQAARPAELMRIQLRAPRPADPCTIDGQSGGRVAGSDCAAPSRPLNTRLALDGQPQG